QFKKSDQFGIVQQFRRALRGSPSEQREEIAKCLRNDAFFAISHHARGTVALTQTRLIGSENERHVREPRQRGSERLVKQNLFRRVGNVVCTTKDVSDEKINIIVHDAQVIGWIAIGAQENEIFQFCVGKFNPLKNRILEPGASSLGNAETQGGWLTGILPGQGLGSSDRTTSPFITRRPFFRRRNRTPFLKLLFAAEAVVCGAGVEQLSRCGAVEISPLALIVRTLIPVNSQPSEALEDALNHLRG